MKKLISILLVAALTFAFALPSFAAKTVSFTASNAEVFAGDEFTVDVFVSDNSQLKSAKFYIKYDERSVQLLDLSVGAIVPSGKNVVSYQNITSSKGNSYVSVKYNDSEASLSSAGKLFSLVFVASDNAIGKTNINISFENGKISTAFGTVTPTVKNAVINIINNNPTIPVETSTAPEETSSDTTESTESTSVSQTVSVTSSVSENVSVSEQITEEIKPEKEKNDNYSQIIIAVAVIVVIAIIIALFDSNSKGKKKSHKKKRKKSRR